MPRVLVIRHGQSEWNAMGRWQGQADPQLSELGRLQAVAAAPRIGAVDAIVASDLVRAQDTAELIAGEIGVGPVVHHRGFRERHAGEWQGLTRAEIDVDWPGYLDDHRRPPGWEPDEAFLTRILDGLALVEQVAAGGGDVLVVSHGGVVYMLERHLGAPWEPLANLGGRWFDLDGDGRLGLGDRVVLVDADRVTVPGQD